MYIIGKDERLEKVLGIVVEILKKGKISCNEYLREKDLMQEALSFLGIREPSCKEGTETYHLDQLGFFDDISPSRLRVFSSTEELLYKNWPTPLVLLRSLSNHNLRVWAKLEFFNPFSMSVKDRIGWSMITDYLAKYNNRTVLYEATSTNTGMALTALANIKGLKVKLFLPYTIQKASDIILRIMGAEVQRVQKSLTVEFVGDVDELAKREGGIHLNQFENNSNLKVHLRYTAKELDLQVREASLKLRGIIGGVGTSGHLSALSLYFKSKYGDNVKVFGAQPAPGNVIPGIRRVESGMKWIHYVKIDKVLDVTSREAIEQAIRIARSEGLFVGLSSGAVMAAFEKLKKNGALQEGDYVLIFPDHGFKYIEQFATYLEETKRQVG
jgi:cysteine synthase/O-phosphoserine sulfhydrylase/cystathionine beta-synthase